MSAPGEDARPGAAERASGGRLGQFKATAKREEEAARRRAALAAQQNEARSSRIADFRRIAMESLLDDSANDVEQEVEVEEEEDDEAAAMVDVGEDERRSNSRRMRRLRLLHRTLFFARQFQTPDWMLEIPEDLATSWFLLVKPEGDRCLMFSDGGRIVVRRKNGHVLEQFNDSRFPRGLTVLEVVCMEGPAATDMQVAPAPDGSHADEAAACRQDPAPGGDEADEPGAVDFEMGGSNPSRCRGSPGRGDGRGLGRGGKGSKGSGRGRRGRPKGDRRYAVMDVLMWGDVDLACADAECRIFWLESRFSELSEKHARRARPLQLIHAVPATKEAISLAYQSDVGYMKDSFLFLHREGHYSISEPITPLALQWRDRHLSRFVVDTPDQKGEVLPERQAVVLELRGGGHLRTADHRIVAQTSEEGLERANGLLQGKGKSKPLLRCEVLNVDVAARKLEGVQPVAHVASRSRVWPDSWGRIVFQHLHRAAQAQCISFDALMRAIH